MADSLNKSYSRSYQNVSEEFAPKIVRLIKTMDFNRKLIRRKQPPDGKNPRTMFNSVLKQSMANLSGQFHKGLILLEVTVLQRLKAIYPAFNTKQEITYLRKRKPIAVISRKE